MGILVLSHCENPAKKEMLEFLTKVLKKKTIAIIPYSIFLGAYHILTRYLRTDQAQTAEKLITTAMIANDIFHPTIDSENIQYALENASKLHVESWDGYLLSIANYYQTNVIFSIDQRLGKFCIIMNPVSEITMEKYYEWLNLQLKK